MKPDYCWAMVGDLVAQAATRRDGALRAGRSSSGAAAVDQDPTAKALSEGSATAARDAQVSTEALSAVGQASPGRPCLQLSGAHQGHGTTAPGCVGELGSKPRAWRGKPGTAVPDPAASNDIRRPDLADAKLPGSSANTATLKWAHSGGRMSAGTRLVPASGPCRAVWSRQKAAPQRQPTAPTDADRRGGLRQTSSQVSLVSGVPSAPSPNVRCTAWRYFSSILKARSLRMS